MTPVAVSTEEPTFSFTRLSWSAQALLIAAIAWGAFAFGCVYPWAYWPLVAAILAVAFLSFSITPASPLPSLRLAPIVGTLMLCSGGLPPLVPLPLNGAARLTHAADPRALILLLAPTLIDIRCRLSVAYGYRTRLLPISFTPVVGTAR